MSGWTKYVAAALAFAVATHFAVIHMVPRVLMNVALERIGSGGPNMWHAADRVTPLARTIVRPSPDFAYSACSYDLGNGPLTLRVTPWDAYWSLSLYAANSDNYYVIDDREARNGVEITLVRHGRRPPEDAVNVIESPSQRGIALIRRLAPTLDEYNTAREIARTDVCGPLPTS
jgi:uncharacterized membrane protein